MTEALRTIAALLAGYLIALPFRHRLVAWLGTHLDPAP